MVILEGSAHAQFLLDTDQGPRLMQEIQQLPSKDLVAMGAPAPL
jgi:hypothetical protein